MARVIPDSITSSLLWDQHLCLPLETGTDVAPLTRYQRNGGAFVSVNAGYSPHCLDETVALLCYYRGAIDDHPDLRLAATADDVAAVAGSGGIAVVFDLEDFTSARRGPEQPHRARRSRCARCFPAINTPIPQAVDVWTPPTAD